MKKYAIIVSIITLVVGSAATQASIIKSMNGRLFSVNPVNGKVSALIDTDGTSPINAKDVVIRGELIESTDGRLFSVNPVNGKVSVLIDTDGKSPINAKDVILNP